LLRPVEPHCFVPQRPEVTQIAAGSTTKIEDGIRRITLHRIEECRVILADIVVSADAAQELKVRRLFAGERRIRTLGSP